MSDERRQAPRHHAYVGAEIDLGDGPVRSAITHDGRKALFCDRKNHAESLVRLSNIKNTKFFTGNIFLHNQVMPCLRQNLIQLHLRTHDHHAATTLPNIRLQHNRKIQIVHFHKLANQSAFFCHRQIGIEQTMPRDKLRRIAQAG